MNEETKEEIVKEAKVYWKELVIVVLFVTMLIFFYQWDKTKKEWQADIASRKAGEIAGKINAPVGEVTNRETNIYPQIDKSIAELNKSIKTLKDHVAKEEKNKPTREQSYAIFNTQSASQISSYFNSIGIPTTVKSCPSK